MKLGFTTSHWDKDYEEYLQTRKRYENELEVDDSASPTDIEKRRQVASDVVRRLHEKRKASETVE